MLSIFCSFVQLRIFKWLSDLTGARVLMGAAVGIVLLSGCDLQIQETAEKMESVIEANKNSEDEKANTSAEHLKPVNPATSDEPAKPNEPEYIILQDGVDAFLGYRRVAVPENLSGIYPEHKDGIIAFLNAFNLREMANEEGVSAWAKIRTSKAGETTWQYELSYLPDDSVYATDHKIYLKDVEGGYLIARIGHRVKCYRGDSPKQWTVELCP